MANSRHPARPEEGAGPLSGLETGAPAAPSTALAQPLRRAFYRAYLAVAGTDSSFDITTGARASGLSDLPLTINETAGAPRTGTYAIFLSGDGGWARFDEEVSDRLAALGIPVVGISTLRYLWAEKTPRQIANDIARIDAHYRRAFARDRVLLLGFSLGANTLPFAAVELSPDLVRRLAGLGLIAPETRTGFEIVAGGWLGRPTGAREVAPAISALAQALPDTPVACLHGREETRSACPGADLPRLRRVAFDGGHHLGHAHDRITAVLAGLAETGS